MRSARVLLALAPLLACLLVACGGGGSSSSSSQATTTAPANPAGGESAARGSAGEGAPRHRSAPPAQSRHTAPPPAESDQHDSGGGSAQFRIKGGDNSIQETGQEATATDRDRAAAALHSYLDAEARRDWGAACSYMSSRARQLAAQLTRGVKIAGKGCSGALAALLQHALPKDLAETAQANVGSLRREGDHGFLLYHGAHGLGYAMPMTLEAGTWKVASLGASALR